MTNSSKCKFIDLFAGMGGIRLGFEKALRENGITPECILTSEIKKQAVETLNHNFEHGEFCSDVTKIDTKLIQDFDFLLAGFPCQAFSSAGNRDGFIDTRGTLFFEVERILKDKRPYGFLLENVEGLLRHDMQNKTDKIGKTLSVILKSLENLGYKVSWELLDSKNFGLAQSRKRVYITGTLEDKIKLKFKEKEAVFFGDIQEENKVTLNTNFTKKLLSHLSPEELYGKSIKDKRGGLNNVHSWDFGVKGEVSEKQKELLSILLKERRKKHWAEKIGIKWMDGMPLTLKQIETFFKSDNLESMLLDLENKGYIKFEYPKELIIKENGSSRREYNISKEKGYNIITGKLSFEFSKILDPNDITPTLVATDVEKIGVIDNSKIRGLTLREGLRLFGYPESYSLDIFSDSNSGKRKAFDLLGNTVTVPVIYEISTRLIESFCKKNKL